MQICCCLHLHFITARCYASAVLAMALCLSVCQSVCLSLVGVLLKRLNDPTNNTTRQPRETSFLLPKISAKFDRGHPLRGHQMQLGWIKIGDFRLLTGYISKTVQDRRMVSIKVEQEVVCALLNGDIAHDLECSLTAPNHPIFCILHRHSQLRKGEPRDFKFGTLTYHSKSHPADEKSSVKGAWSGSVDPFQNFTPHVKSPQQLMLETSNFVHGSSQSCDE